MMNKRKDLTDEEKEEARAIKAKGRITREEAVRLMELEVDPEDLEREKRIIREKCEEMKEILIALS